ncbi:hypothetical protein [Pannonibacter sp.]|uniref:hypothetical protein n=1 Tax=Pannonibacter sp. TaxID=1906786 RepID=UPI003F70E3A2
MIRFCELDDRNPALSLSPLVRGVEKTLGWMAEHGDIPLTPGKAFKRSFVHWAAAEFAWPGHTAEELFAICKVLNEGDFMPLQMLHGLMLAMRLGRHYKGEFRLTKAGRDLAERPGRIFSTMVPVFLFQLDHASLSARKEEAPPLVNWDVFLNVLNVETRNGASGDQLRRVFFGEPESSPAWQHDHAMRDLYISVLRPLCWAGLLQKTEVAGSFSYSDAIFSKTPLWQAALRLDTDGMVRFRSAPRDQA